MARKLKDNQPRWIKFDKDPDIQFKINPFSYIKFKIRPISFEGPAFVGNIFTMFVIDWKGITDKAGKDLVCNEANRKKIASENTDLIYFVYNEVFSKPEPEDKDKKEEIKN